jgi:Spy/CpxP family protein refolding chaperone
MKPVSAFAIAAAFALSAVATLPAVAQTDPYGGQPPQGSYQGGPPPGAQGGYPGPGAGQQGYGPEGYGAQGGGRNMGNMTLQQFQARQVSNMMRMDTDHDGRISLAEWTAWREAHPGRNGAPVDPARGFARLDLNHDGFITPDEIAGMAARRYARMQQGGARGMGPGMMGPGGGNPPPEPLGPN